mmetsp:Transcript_6245/g.24148  ORF Transcript_6245/g.24148 Transcript_6245/m.24148 type:complete len:215 (+) Transcript_6245:1616-2260(+)
MSLSLRISSRRCSSGRYLVTLLFRPSCRYTSSAVMRRRTCSRCRTMHRSRHRIAALYELLKLGSSMRKSRMGTLSMLASLCFSMDTAVHAPSSSILSHAFGPSGLGFAEAGMRPSAPEVTSLSCATMTLPTSSEPFGTCTMALSCSDSVPVREMGRDGGFAELETAPPADAGAPREGGRAGGGGIAPAPARSVKSTLLVLRRYAPGSSATLQDA